MFIKLFYYPLGVVAVLGIIMPTETMGMETAATHVVATEASIASALYDQQEVINPINQVHQVEHQIVEVPFDNENWFTLPHPEPSSFTVTKSGEVYGTTTTGIPFVQINVPNDFGVRVQKFIIQNHYHYILADKVVYTEMDLEAAMLEIASKN